MNRVATPSDRLAQYIADVEASTLRRTVIVPFPNASPTDIVAAELNLGPSFTGISIRFRPLQPLSHPAIEKAIAHELTHAMLFYAQGYPSIDGPDEIPQETFQVAGDVMDFIDDVIVDTMIQSRGFPPTTPEHLAPFETNCRVFEQAQSRAQIDPHIANPVRAEIKFVGDYIYAWAMPRYAKLDPTAINVFRRFTRRFPQIMKREYSKARFIKDLFRANDIFDIEGRTRVVKGALSLWPIDPRIRLAPLNAA